MTYDVSSCRLLPALAVALCTLFPGIAGAQRAPTPPASVPGQYQPPPPPQTSQNPVCFRLETQLASVERGGGDTSRAAMIRRNEEIVNRQQAEVDRLVTQQRRLGCQSAGIFSIFTAQPPQCPALMSQIDQARGQLDRAMNDLQRSQSGGNDLESQRQSLLAALAQNNCGPQYRAAAAAPQRGIFDTIFGGSSGGSYGGVDVSRSGTFRTLCVRMCDGYYYPISFATSPSHFQDDEQTCRNTCPNAEVGLYSHRTSEDVRYAANVQGRRYVDLPNAFRYRQQFDASCSCRKPGQSWADAMGQTRDRMGRGDIIVTDETSKSMSAPRFDPRTQQQSGNPPGSGQPAAAPAPDQRPIRSIGPASGPVR